MNNNTPSKVSRLDLKRQQIAAGKQRRDVVPHSEQMFIPLDKLVEDPQNERKTFSKEDIAELAASMKAEAQIEPITVEAIDGGKYMVLTGHRRLRAAKLLAWPELEALVRPESRDAQTRRIKSLISNIQRKDVAPIELAQTLNWLIESEGVTQDEIARRLGKDKSWVSRILRIQDLPEDLQKEVATSQLPMSAESLAEVARVPDRKKQKALVRDVVRGATVRQVREKIKLTKPKRVGDGRSITKPKEVYPSRQAVVIVQSKTTKLSQGTIVEALQNALRRASKKKK